MGKVAWLLIPLSLLMTPLFAGVNPDGSFSTSIPIEIPAGLNGVQPQLALQYNSSTSAALGNSSIVGIGWSMQGLPRVTRGSRIEGGVNYTETDFLSGDGEDGYYYAGTQLVPVNVGGGGYNSLFHSRIEEFAKFEPSGLCGDGPCQWKMTDKSGVQFFSERATTRVLSATFP